MRRLLAFLALWPAIAWAQPGPAWAQFQGPPSPYGGNTSGGGSLTCVGCSAGQVLTWDGLALAPSKAVITQPASSSTITVVNGKTLTSNNTLTFSGTDGSTLNIGTGGTLGAAAYSVATITLGSSTLTLGGTTTALAGMTAIGLTSAGTLSWNSDLFEVRDAANIKAQRNGTSSQIQRVYHSWTDASNGSWAFIDPGTTTANLLSIGSRSNGTGAGYFTKFQIEVDGTNKLDFGVANAGSWTIPSGIGLYIVNASLDVTANNGGVVMRGTTPRLTYNNYGSIRAVSDGVFNWTNDAGSDFGRMTFGGTTSSFPAIKRSAALLQARLADDSAYAGFEANTLRTATAYTVATLPAAGSAGRRAYITDQLTTCAVVGATLTGGGAVICPVFDNGTVWVGG